VEEILSKTPYDAPEFVMDKSIDDFYKFTVDSFRFENYQFHTLGKRIPVAI